MYEIWYIQNLIFTQAASTVIPLYSFYLTFLPIQDETKLRTKYTKYMAFRLEACFWWLISFMLFVFMLIGGIINCYFFDETINKSLSMSSLPCPQEYNEED